MPKTIPPFVTAKLFLTVTSLMILLFNKTYGGCITSPPAITVPIPLCSGCGNGFTNVKLNTTINRTSSEFEEWATSATTAQTAVLNQSGSYTLTFTQTNWYPMRVRAWIDYNSDGDFLDAGELLGTSALSSGTGPVTANFSFTASASASGLKNMRVAVDYDDGVVSTGAPVSNNNWYGEVEDYIVNITPVAAMTYNAASTTTQNNTSTVYKATTNQEVIGIEVITNNSTSALSATSFTFLTNGTTNVADISNAKLWYTGNSCIFSAATQLGATFASPPVSGTPFTINGFTKTLFPNTNYFWLTYDVPSGAVSGNVIDAQCSSFIVGGVSRTPAVTTPAGTRTIYDAFTSSTTTQNTTTAVGTSTTSNEVIGVQIVMTQADNVTNFTFNTTGTTAPATDITNAKVWYTSNVSVFSVASATQFGSTIGAPNGSFNIAGSATMVVGTNYFWLTYDVPSGATLNNSIDGQCTSITVGGKVRTPAVTIPAGTRLIQNMQYGSCITTQNNTTSVTQGTTTAQVVGIEIVTTVSNGSPLSATSFTFRTTGTTSVADISNAKLWYTGNSSVFAAINQFGSAYASPPATPTTYNITGTQTLTLGTNYFWLTYDVSGTAGAGNVIDAECTSLTVGTAKTPATQAPSGNRPIVLYTTPLISTIAGTGNGGFSGNGGLATAADIMYPEQLALDASCNLYFTDPVFHHARKIDMTTGIITEIAGVGGPYGGGSFSGDGGPAVAAELNQPCGIAVDASGNIYIADQLNNRIRKVAAGTGIISTIAGNGNANTSGDGGLATAAEVNSPFSVAVDLSGNVYIAGGGYNTGGSSGMVRKINVSTGIITTIAGTGGFGYVYTDGVPATTSDLNSPVGVAVDASGNVYILDGWGGRIRKVTATTGIISTVAGNGTIGFSGDGGLATAAQIYPIDGEVAVDALGNVYLADEQNCCIRKIDAVTGIITRIAGTGIACIYNGDGIPATSATVYNPRGVAVDAYGNVYESDNVGQRIRKITFGGGCAVPLPVEYISFSGKNAGNVNLLEWTTAAEINNDFFTIERKDESGWQAIGTIKGAGNTSTSINYKFNDQNITLSGSEVYYRLKQVDFDGGFTYSKIVAVQLPVSDFPISVYPVPANKELNCKFYSKRNSEINISISDVVGNVVKNEAIKTIKGMNDLKLNINELSQGVYLLKVSSISQQSQIKFIKQ